MENKTNIIDYYLTLSAREGEAEDPATSCDLDPGDQKAHSVASILRRSLDLESKKGLSGRTDRLERLGTDNKRISSSVSKLPVVPEQKPTKNKPSLMGAISVSHDRPSSPFIPSKKETCHQRLQTSKSMPNLREDTSGAAVGALEVSRSEKEAGQIVKDIFHHHSSEGYAKIKMKLLSEKKELNNEAKKIFDIQVAEKMPFDFCLFYLASCTDLTLYRPSLSCTPRKFLSILIIRALRHNRLTDLLHDAHIKDKSLFQNGCMATVLSQSYLDFKRCNFAAEQARSFINRVTSFRGFPGTLDIQQCENKEQLEQNQENFQEILNGSISDLCKKELPLPLQLILTIRRKVVEQHYPDLQYPNAGKHIALNFLMDIIGKQYLYKVRQTTQGKKNSLEEAVLNLFWKSFVKRISSFGASDNKELEELIQFIENNTQVDLYSWSPRPPRNVIVEYVE